MKSRGAHQVVRTEPLLVQAPGTLAARWAATPEVGDAERGLKGAELLVSKTGEARGAGRVHGMSRGVASRSVFGKHITSSPQLAGGLEEGGYGGTWWKGTQR